jgi:ATP-dependent Clp protease ATP-binding subunit ClpC
MDPTPRNARVLAYARENCHLIGTGNFLSSLHLIVGLLRLKQGVAAKFLKSNGVSIQSVEEYVSQHPSSNEPAEKEFDLLVGRSVHAALARAEQEATRCGHTFVGTRHLLLALFAEQNGPTADFCDSLKLDRTRLGAELRREMGFNHATSLNTLGSVS